MKNGSRKTICVFGASAEGISRDMILRSSALCEKLGNEGFDLVFGGFARGMMAAAAEGFARAGAEITGVVPDSLYGRRTVHPACTKIIRTGDLLERKARMSELADGYVALPGGIGTLDEVFGVLAERVVGESACPVVLYSLDGFYRGLMDWLNGIGEQGFLYSDLSELLLVSDDADEICSYLSRQIG